MKSWGYKIKYTFLRTIREKMEEHDFTLFAFVGVVFTLAEILNNVF